MCAEGVIAAVAVEVAAVVAGVVENAVQNHAHSALFRLLTQRFEVLLASEQRVDALVVAGVVAVVGVRLKNRVEVDGLHVQAFEVVELFHDAAQLPPKKSLFRISPCSSGR